MIALLVDAQFLPALRTVPFGSSSRNLGEIDTCQVEPFFFTLLYGLANILENIYTYCPK
jgi:hypothetical protein